jgi:uncharacterized membrane protein
MNNATSAALRYCLLFGLILTAAGLMLSEYDCGDRIMRAGLLVLILSPFAGVTVTCIYLIKERDLKWAKVAILLIAVILIGLALSILNR